MSSYNYLYGITEVTPILVEYGIGGGPNLLYTMSYEVAMPEKAYS